MEKTSLEDARGVIISASDYLYFQKLKDADKEDKDPVNGVDYRICKRIKLFLDKYAKKEYRTPTKHIYKVGQFCYNLKEIYSMSDEEFKAYILDV